MGDRTKRRHGNEPADLVKYPVTTYAGSRNYRDYPIAIRSDHANFVTQSPGLPLYAGDIQCSSLRSLVRDCISGSRSRHYPVFRPLYDHQSYVITLSAFLGSLLGLAIILIIIRGKQASVETIILSGVIINSLFGAGIAVMQYVANNVQLASIVFWNFGDLGRSDWSKLLFLIVALIPALIYFYLKRWDYKVLCSGDDYAQSMGVYPQHTRMTGMVVTSLITAVAVSFFGVIAFVGLVVPHIVRKCIGDNEEFLIPGSAIFGGMFLLLCDTVARTILSPIILPVGILTSFLGVPLFLFLLTRKKR